MALIPPTLWTLFASESFRWQYSGECTTREKEQITILLLEHINYSSSGVRQTKLRFIFQFPVISGVTGRLLYQLGMCVSVQDVWLANRCRSSWWRLDEQLQPQEGNHEKKNYYYFF